MAVHVETLDKLERRITLTLPASTIASEVESRLRRLSRTVRADGFRPGKVPMSVVSQRYGYSVHSEVLNDKVGQVFSRGGQRGQAARRRAAADHREGRGARGRGRLRRDLRGLSRGQARRPVAGRDRARHDRGHRRSGRQDDRDPQEAAAHVPAAPGERGRRRRRPRHDRFRRHRRRRSVRRRQGRGLPVRDRRRPDARAVRQRRARHEGRRLEDLPAPVPGRLPGQGRRRQGSRLHRHAEEDRGAAPAARRRGARQGARHRRRHGRGACAPTFARTSSARSSSASRRATRRA